MTKWLQLIRNGHHPPSLSKLSSCNGDGNSEDIDFCSRDVK